MVAMRWYLLLYLLCAIVLLLQGCQEDLALLLIVLDLIRAKMGQVHDELVQLC
jgi:hypothetical protein